MKYANKLHYIINKKIIVSIQLFILIISSLPAESGLVLPRLIPENLLIGNISTVELDLLNARGLVMKNLESYKDIHLLPESTETKSIIDHYKKLRPNFLAEAMFIMPVLEGEEQAVLQDVKIFLQSVKEFEEIPYYSKQNNTWVPMFESIVIKGVPIFSDGSEGIITEQIMLPFKPYTSVYKYYLSEDSFLYKNYNRTPLYYKWMKGVEKEEMSTTLLVRAYPGYLFIYGLGGAKAFDFFGFFGKRLDVAFTGRVEAFFEWFYKEFVLSRMDEN